MGIKGLMKLLRDHAPGAVKEREPKYYFGRKLAVDASMFLYQFLIQIRTGDNAQQLTNESGEVTSHLNGMFYRTIRMLEVGIKPVFVFDGKAPELKKGEIEKRKERKAESAAHLQEAKDAGNAEDILKYERQATKVTKEHNEEAKKLLTLMGVPVVDAPGEAEAQCAAMCNADLVYAAVTEDMDCLTFGTKRLLRKFTKSEAKKEPIEEVDLEQVLAGLKLNMDEFIQLCVLCGCDYADSIRGIGPFKALDLVRQYKSIDKILHHLPGKATAPENWKHKEAADFFKKPDIQQPADMKALVWKEPDEKGVLEFMCTQKGFNTDRIKAGLKRIEKAKGLASQQRMESFFTMTPAKRKDPPKQDEKKKSGSAMKGSIKGSKGAKKGKPTGKEPPKKKAKKDLKF